MTNLRASRFCDEMKMARGWEIKMGKRLEGKIDKEKVDFKNTQGALSAKYFN